MGTRYGGGEGQGQQGRGGVSLCATARRRHDGVETGIFKYTVIEKSGASSSKFYPFEQLLVKTNGKWRVLMERQFAEVTQDAWDKLPK